MVGATCSIANLAHHRATTHGSTGPPLPKDPLYVGGAYESRRAARRIDGLAFVRRDVFELRSDRPCASPPAGRGTEIGATAPCVRIA
jgi:hypothetical protein